MRCSLRNFIGIVLSILKVVECRRRSQMQRRSQCGDYPCKAPRIKVSPKNATLPFGEPHTLRCRALGNPVPTIIWEKNGIRIDPHNRNLRIQSLPLPSKNKRTKAVKSLLRIQGVETEDEGRYACIASNSLKTVQSATAYVTLNPETAGNPAKIPGSTGYDYDSSRVKQCIPYKNGTTCARYLDPSRSIFTANGKETLFVLENMLSSLVPHLKDNSMHLSTRCQPHVLPFLCYYNFPYCAKNTRAHTRVNICRKDCSRIRSSYCDSEFATALQDDLMKTLIPKNCLSLPTHDCLSMEDEIDRVQHLLQKKTGKVVNAYRGPKSSAIDATDNCYFNRGEHYRGIENYTESKLPCVSWLRSAEGSKNAELLAGHNYCRNIKSKYERPWCYVRRASRKLEFEYCNVPRCALPVRAPATNILYTIIPCLVFALALSLAIIIVAWKRHKQHYYQSAPSSPKQVVPRVNPKIEELNREDMCDFRLLGDGSIGRVYTADYTGCKDGKTFTACVAVKAIIEKATSKQIEDFVREAETRANFKHESVVSLIGVISSEEPLSLIYEYTECGDLHEYLLRHSPNFSDAHANDDFGPLEYPDLLVIATQIASGMTYLSTHAFVHKDLAARNCLVASNGIIKISDFSGLRDLYAGDYYRAPGRPPLPVRWMSPEAISQCTFINASDVWSYGVTLWEIFSYGSRPFFGFSNYEAMNLIAEYELVLPCPEGCPQSLFVIMQECWTKAPEGRPSFVEIYNRLKSMDEINVNPQPMMLHHELSVPSLTATMPNISGYMGREVTSNPFHRPSISSSRSHSLHSGHSSSASSSSGHHPASIESASRSVPPSLVSVPHQRQEALMHTIATRNGHHVLPRDEYLERHYPHDPHYGRPSSANSSSLHRSSGPHSNGYLPPGSYMSSLQSYPPSMGCPPTMFSRQSSSRASNHESSGYDSINRGTKANLGHIYL